MSSDWKFDANIVPIFDEHVRQSVPMYDEIHRLITDISAWFLEDGTNMYDIGTSTGEVLSNISKTYPKKSTTLYGIDNSSEMVEKARERFSQNKNINIDSLDLTKDKYVLENACLITSVLTMQFIPHRFRQNIVNNIYKGLNKGGCFIFVEKVVGSNARFNEMWVEMYHEMKLRNGLTEKHVFEKASAIRGVMRPYTLKENIEMLDNAGFKDIDTFFKWNNFVGFVAIK
ncbi:methyltransferase domain-containing protein [Lederbergia citrisecunda]|uniref:methyltransferase domain-containing protein n=1 Tax=Lederbergia citrisecunda TaxID=2833583 RepID=UPI003D2E6404